jgi:uncharacterized hydrophobic protein (TIGR00271 family)
MEHERDSLTQIRFSRPMSAWQVIVSSASVVIFLSAFVSLKDVVATAGPLTPVAYLLASLLLLINLLGYIELTVSSPRTGGAYTQVHNVQEGWLAFSVGWAVTLTGLGASALLARGFAAQVTTLLRDHLDLALPELPFALGLVILMAINNALGTKKSRYRLLTLVLLMTTLVVISLIAMPRIRLAHYTLDHHNIGYAVPLLIAAFIGMEIAANLQSQTHDRAARAPRTIFLTLGLTAAIGAVVFAILVGVAGTSTVGESSIPLVLLGAYVARGAGMPLVLVVGALGLAISLNITLKMTLSQVYLMSKDGYLPAIFHRLDARARTPTWAIVLVGALILPLILLPTSLLSRLTGLVYLLVLIGVNFVVARRSQHKDSSFTLPFHPWVPALTIAVDVLICRLWGPICLAAVAGCLGAGTVFYLAYARSHHIKAREGITVFRPPSEARSEAKYRVLVPIANPATASTLLHLAGLLARQKEGEVLALQVVIVPDQVPLEEGRRRAATSRLLLDQAIAQAKEESFAIQTMTRVAHGVAQGILDTAREEKVDLILMGWRGYTRSFGASMGPVIDAVIRDAPCDVTVAKGDEWTEAKRILLPTAGGPHAPIAAQLAVALSDTFCSEVTALYVQLGRATPQQMEMNRQRIAETLKGLEFNCEVEQKVIIAESVVEGIVREAEGYDLVLLGASETGLFDQFIFGTIPQQIAARVPKTAVIVRRYGGPTQFWARKLVQWLLQVFPRLNVEEQLELREQMSKSANPGVNYFVLIVLSSIIATLGLLLNSAAVVIGAMLVAPLMSPILGFSLGMVLSDVRLIRLSIEAVFKGVALALLMSIVIGILSPFKELTGELMARTQPNLLDLVVALTSGMAGAYALARKDVSAALPGVAIAAALMPPLSVAGLGLSWGEPQIAGGAFLLFLTNIASISLAGVIVFLVLGVRPQTWQPEARRQIQRGLVGFIVLLAVITIPLAVIMADIVQDTAMHQSIQDVLETEASAQDAEMVMFEVQEEGDSLVIVATIRSVQALNQETVDEMADTLSAHLDQPVTLEIIPSLVVRSEGR